MPTKRDDVTPDILRGLLRYEPETGKLIWLPRTPDTCQVNSFFQNDAHCRHWNEGHAGTEAFTTPTAYGYLGGSIFNIDFLAHRVIWAMVFDEWPPRTDHVEGRQTDNRLHLIRAVDDTGNNRNKRISKANKSGINGVSWHSRKRYWYAHISVNSRPKFLGCFKTKEAAAKARKEADVRYGYHPNHGRLAA